MGPADSPADSPADNGPPDPAQARSSEEFVALLQTLKDWSGLTYRELTSRADAVGDVLPRSTVANMLGRSTVPREELVVAFVRACGCGPAATENWLRARKGLARRERQSVEVPEYGAGEPEPESEPDGAGPEMLAQGGPDTGEPGPPGRRRRRLIRAVLAGVVVLGVAAVAVTYAVREESDDKPEVLTSGPPRPADVRIKAVHSGLCLAETGGQNGQLYQLPCAPDTIPRFSLKPLEAKGTWRIVTFHPTYGEGCSGVMERSKEDGAPIEDQECGKRGDAEAFRLEPVGDPVLGYRLRPLHNSDFCVGVPEASKEKGVELRQVKCTENAEGQLFAFLS